MASITDRLNNLLVRERGIVESVLALAREIESTDPDIAESAGDVLETAEWACQGLYHVIVRLGGTVSLESADLADKLTEQPDLESKLELLCAEQKHGAAIVKGLLNDKDIDNDTRDFLNALLNAYKETDQWCVGTLADWVVER